MSSVEEVVKPLHHKEKGTRNRAKKYPKVLYIRVSEETQNKLIAKAHQEDRPLSQTGRRLIEKGLEE